MQLDAPLTGQHTLLRTLTVADASADYLGWLSDPAITRYLEVRFAPPQSAVELAAFITACNTSSDSLLLAICRRSDGRHIGNIKLGPIDRHHGTADIGLLLGEKSEWGKGHASTAIALLTQHAFSELGIEKLTAGCYADNAASRRAFLKAGYAEEGRRRAQWLVDGQRQDGILLGKARSPANAGEASATDRQEKA